MTTPTTLPPHRMERLAFIRLLHLQGIDQSNLPEPLSFGCVLAFHDAVELFLILAGEHLQVPVPRGRGSFVEKHFAPIDEVLVNTRLGGRAGVDRLTSQRNSFKHANLWPGPTALEGFRADTQAFFEDNTPLVFGIDYSDIDMADLISLETARDLVKEAALADANGDLREAMALLREAFDELFREHVDQDLAPAPFANAPFAIGPDLRRPPMEREIRAALVNERGTARELASHLRRLAEITEAAQAALRVMTLGLDYHAYIRFGQLTPHVSYTYGADHRYVEAPDAYAPTAEHYGYCRQFVITAALRYAEREQASIPPPWFPKRERPLRSMRALYKQRTGQA